METWVQWAHRHGEVSTVLKPMVTLCLSSRFFLLSWAMVEILTNYHEIVYWGLLLLLYHQFKKSVCTAASVMWQNENINWSSYYRCSTYSSSDYVRDHRHSYHACHQSFFLIAILLSSMWHLIFTNKRLKYWSLQTLQSWQQFTWVTFKMIRNVKARSKALGMQNTGKTTSLSHEFYLENKTFY